MTADFADFQVRIELHQSTWKETRFSSKTLKKKQEIFVEIVRTCHRNIGTNHDIP